MKFLIIDTDYPPFLEAFYEGNPGLESSPYEEQLQKRYDTLFGVADFYSHALRKLGHEAQDIYFNNRTMQTAWASEHGVIPRGDSTLGNLRAQASQTPLRLLKPLVSPVLKYFRPDRSLYDILLKQIVRLKPDVILNQALAHIDPQWCHEIKPHVPLLIGQHASGPLRWNQYYRAYDLVISSFPPTVDFFRDAGVPAVLNLLGFDPRVLDHLNGNAQTVEVSFVGSLQKMHSSRVPFLEELCSRFDGLKVWTSKTAIPAGSVIHTRYAGTVWGKEMYQVLKSSKITINHHGDFLPWANNLRLFEATGVGAFLMTDWRSNLTTMFEPGKEVAAYKNSGEAGELIQHFMTHDDERRKMAEAAQQRTLREHTYDVRLDELVRLIDAKWHKS